MKIVSSVYVQRSINQYLRAGFEKIGIKPKLYGFSLLDSCKDLSMWSRRNVIIYAHVCEHNKLSEEKEAQFYRTVVVLRQMLVIRGCYRNGS